jgi:hypothetical protein
MDPIKNEQELLDFAQNMKDCYGEMKEKHTREVTRLHRRIRGLKRTLSDYQDEDDIPALDSLHMRFHAMNVYEQHGVLRRLNQSHMKRRKRAVSHLQRTHDLQEGQYYVWSHHDGHPHRMYAEVPNLWIQTNQVIRLIHLNAAFIYWEYLFVTMTHPTKRGGTHYYVQRTKDVMVGTDRRRMEWFNGGCSFHRLLPLKQWLLDCSLFYPETTLRALRQEDALTVRTDRAPRSGHQE